MRKTLLVLSILLAAPAVPCQGGEGMDAIKKILDKVAEEMDEIDRLLRESSKSDAAARMAENVSRKPFLASGMSATRRSIISGIPCTNGSCFRPVAASSNTQVPLAQ